MVNTDIETSTNDNLNTKALKKHKTKTHYHLPDLLLVQYMEY